MLDIVVIGSLNTDLVIKTTRMPAPGETLHGEDLRTIPGGKGANQAAAAARLGSRVAMVGRVGADQFGPHLVDNLAHQGVNTGHIRVDPGACTGVALIMVDGQGENSILLSSGANGKVSPADVDSASALLAQARLLLLQFEIPLEAVRHALEKASKLGIKVILNPAPAIQITPDLLNKIDILVPNQTELEILSGMPITDDESTQKAARTLLEKGVGVVVVTLGERGALLVTPQDTTLVPGIKVDVVDTTAAGDAFIGALATAIVREMPLPEAVRFANCAGALATTRFGAQPSLPSANEVYQVYSRGFLRA
jgi:ribokinase